MGYRYLIFGFSHYYPGGGMNDIQLKTDDLEEVKKFVYEWENISRGRDFEQVHVFDLVEDTLVYKARFDVEDYLDRDARTLSVSLSDL